LPKGVREFGKSFASFEVNLDLVGVAIPQDQLRFLFCAVHILVTTMGTPFLATVKMFWDLVGDNPVHQSHNVDQIVKRVLFLVELLFKSIHQTHELFSHLI